MFDIVLIPSATEEVPIRRNVEIGVINIKGHFFFVWTCDLVSDDGKC